ncbi:MAG: response regulator [bacterium]
MSNLWYFLGVPGLEEGRTFVLLVEDEAVVAHLIQEVLRFLQYDAVSAGSVEEALRVWTKHREEIAVVMLDWTLPGSTGDGLLRSLRAANPRLPVVLMSGDPTLWEEDVDGRGERTSLLKKPFTIEEVREALARVLA